MAETKRDEGLPLDDNDPFDDVTHWVGRMRKDEDIPDDEHSRGKRGRGAYQSTHQKTSDGH